MSEALVVPFAEATRVWSRIAWRSFGGPAAQIAVMHHEVVVQRRWIGERRFLHALGFCMLLPGPEAMQLVTWLGWLLHGWRGGLVAGLLFVLPGFLSILALSAVYVAFRDVPGADGLLLGVQAAVIAVIAEAVGRLGRRVGRHAAVRALSVASFFAIFMFAVPFPVVVAAAAAIGGLVGRWMPEAFAPVALPDAEGRGLLDDVLDARHAAHAPSVRRAASALALWGAVWLVPVVGLVGLRGPEDVLSRVAIFFSQAAMVTFGGAYAVLGFVAQRAVEDEGWLSGREMIEGLAFAEATPGPLIQVVQHVGFLAGYHQPGDDPAWAMALAGAVVATWVTFAPCFLWIFVGAPWVEALRGVVGLRAALTGVTAAVVGVVAQLGLWMALQVLFGEVGVWTWGPLQVPWPALHTLDLRAVLIAAVAGWALLVRHVDLLWVIAASAVAGVALTALG